MTITRVNLRNLEIQYNSRVKVYFKFWRSTHEEKLQKTYADIAKTILDNFNLKDEIKRKKAKNLKKNVHILNVIY